MRLDKYISIYALPINSNDAKLSALFSAKDMQNLDFKNRFIEKIVSQLPHNDEYTQDRIARALFSNGYPMERIISKYGTIDSERRRAVLAAAEVGNKDALEKMTDSHHAFSLKVKGNLGYTPAHFAAADGKLDVVKFIAQHAPESMDVKNDDGKTPRELLSEHPR
jgi:ankyrin repeat protein